MFTGPLFQIKLHLQSIILIQWEGRFYECGGHDKRNFLKDRANFYRSRAWQIVLIIITANVASMGQLYDKTIALLGTYRAYNGEKYP